MKKVLTLSVFNGGPHGHGGEKRTLQIKELVSSRFNHSHIVFPVNYPNTPRVTLRNKILRSFRVPEVWRASKFSRKAGTINRILIEAHKLYVQEKILKTHQQEFQQADTVIWENNYHDFLYFPYLIKKMFGCKVIACPQNIESLVPRAMTGWMGTTKLEYLAQELEPFQLCDEVYSISEEDQWLLNLLGIKAKCLPFFPPSELIKSYSDIRAFRGSHAPEDFFLIVGSVGNPPTLSGMLRLLSDLAKINESERINYKIVGYGTEVLLEKFGKIDRFEILGTVEQLKLENLLKRCKAMIIAQEYCTGALTKVPEVLVSGIPIIMNTGASRSYKRLDGVSVYDSIQELKKYLNMSFKIPSLHRVPVDRYEQFLLSIE